MKNMQSKWERDGAKILANINNACTRICMRSPADPLLTPLHPSHSLQHGALNVCPLYPSAICIDIDIDIGIGISIYPFIYLHTIYKWALVSITHI